MKCPKCGGSSVVEAPRVSYGQREFKVGDKVRLKDDLIVGKQYGRLRFLDAMLGRFGDEVAEIVHINPDLGLVHLLGNPYFRYSPEMLELARRELPEISEEEWRRLSNKRSQREFKVGDELIKTGLAGDLKKGEKVTITKLDLDVPVFQLTDSQGTHYVINDIGLQKHFQLLPKPLPEISEEEWRRLSIRQEAIDWGRVKKMLLAGVAISSIAVSLGYNKEELLAKAPAEIRALLGEKMGKEVPIELQSLAKLIYSEAGNQLYAGKQAVGNVVMNRVRAGWGDLNKVIFAPNQFSGVGTREWTKAENMITTKSYDKAMEDSIRAAKEVLEGIDITGGALYYRNPSYRSPWFERMVEEGTLIPIKDIGAHKFYKEGIKRLSNHIKKASVYANLYEIAKRRGYSTKRNKRVEVTDRDITFYYYDCAIVLFDKATNKAGTAICGWDTISTKHNISQALSLLGEDFGEFEIIGDYKAYKPLPEISEEEWRRLSIRQARGSSNPETPEELKSLVSLLKGAVQKDPSFSRVDIFLLPLLKSVQRITFRPYRLVSKVRSLVSKTKKLERSSGREKTKLRNEIVKLVNEIEGRIV